MGHLELLIEERSRFGNRGVMLPPDSGPRDGMRRVVVNWHRDALNYHTATDDELKFHFPSLVINSILDLAVEGDRVWCVGEMPVAEAREISAIADAGSVTEINSLEALAVCTTRTNRLLRGQRWPTFCGGNGTRIIVFRESTSEAEDELHELLASVTNEKQNAKARWDAIRRKCLVRDTLARYCNDAIFCAQPDGPHFTEIGIHTKRLSCQEISKAIESACRRVGIQLLSIENTSNEYIRFFELG